MVSERDVLASTAGDGTQFEAQILNHKIRKTERYSFQRAFSEVYNLGHDYDSWLRKIGADFSPIPCSVQSKKNLMPRCVAPSRFTLRAPVWNVSSGEIRTRADVEKIHKNGFLTGIGPKFKGYKEDELEVIPSIELQRIETVFKERIEESFSGNKKVELKANSFHILDFGTNLTGFLGARISCRRPCRFFFIFDEILSGGDVDFKRLGCVNIVSHELQPGRYELESFEPYTLRYLKLIVLDGDCDVEQVYVREYANPDAYRAHFSSSDREVNRIFEAGRETFRQNAVDIFMDCPSRERAGWLCDSYFTARAAFSLCGNTIIERNFFENFMLVQKFENIPVGMLPMCYPADHYNGNFIPNWALWFVVQLEEYLTRSGDPEMVEALREKVIKLLDYFAPFKNEDGLLEKLDGWVFVEWSKANDFVQDVNYPTNMLYAAALEAAGRLYHQSQFIDEAEKIKKVVREQSFGGRFFVDNAIRKNGRLEVTDNRTEACQYYAFFFGVAMPETHQELWTNLVEVFGPQRDEENIYPEIHKSRAFIGNQLRFDLLSRYGLTSRLLDEVKRYLLPMADLTGTLWEHDDTQASCNHGFASYVVHVLHRDVLGVYCIDALNRTITLRFSDLPLDWCEGRIPIGEDAVSLRWWRQGSEIHYRVDIPAGFLLKVENISDRMIVQHP